MIRVGDRVKVVGGAKLEVKTPFYVTVLKVYHEGVLGKKFCGKEILILNEELEE